MLKQFVFILIFIALKLQSQQIHHVMINACQTEGANEYFFLQNGSSSFVANATNISLRYGTTSPASGNYTSSFLATGNANYVNALNAKLTSGCKFVFKNAPIGTTIMPNKYFMVMYSGPTDTANFSAWCNVGGMDTVYVLFSNTPLWNTTGNFANNPSSARYFRSVINGVTIDYDYVNGWGSNIDGNYVKFPVGGGSGVSYNNAPSCNPANVIGLPIALISFKGSLQKNYLNINAKVTSDNGGDKYKIEIADNTMQWQVLEENYQALNGIIRYEKYLEFNADKLFVRFTNNSLQETLGPFVIINAEKNIVRIYPNPFSGYLFVNSNEESTLTIFDITGKTVLTTPITEGTNSINTQQLLQGVYWAKIGDKVYKVIK